MIGDSNMVGQVNTSLITSSQRTNVGTSYANVHLKQELCQTAVPDPIAWSTGPTTGSLAAYSTSVANNSGATTNCLGLVTGFGRHMDYYKSNFDIVEVAVSGSRAWDHWDPAGTYPTGTRLFDQMISYAQAAQSELGGTIVGAVISLNSNDAANASAAPVFATSMNNIVTALRSAFPNIPIVTYKLSVNCGNTFTSTVRTQTDTFAAGLTNGTVVNVDDIPLGADLIHYTADSYNALGDRLADALLTLLSVPNPKAWTIDSYKLIGLPQNATEWAAVIAAAGCTNTGGPSLLWDFNGLASGNVTDAIGTFTGTATGTLLTYQSTDLYDFKRRPIKEAAGTGQFTNTAAGLPDPATTSWLRIMALQYVTAATVRNVYLMGTAGFDAISMKSGGWQAQDPTAVGGTLQPQGQMRVFVQKRDKTNVVSAAYNDMEKIALTQGVVTGKQVTLFHAASNGTAYCLQVADFFGAAAEKSDADIRAIVRTLNWWNPSATQTSAPW